MNKQVDPQIASVLHLLPLKDPADLTPQRARDELIALANAGKSVPLPIPAHVAEATIVGAMGNIPARIYKPNRFPCPTVIYFHGGGWVAGDINTADRAARLLAIEVKAVVVSVDYRRPPETPFPGPFEDCVAAVQWAATNIASLGGDGSRLGVAGDSAGANLAAAVTQFSRTAGPRLKGQLLVYPPTDLVGKYADETENARFASRAENADGYFLTMESMRFFTHHYLTSVASERDPRASPLRAQNFSDLPPAVICTAEFDPLRDEGEAYARALEAAGNRVIYFREPGMIHGYFSLGTVSPAALDASTRGRAAFKSILHEA